jgi:hypothetical protein
MDCGMEHLRLKSSFRTQPVCSKSIGMILCLLFFLAVSNARAQISISSPVNHQVLQRDSSGYARIAITGYIQYPYSSLEVKLTPTGSNTHSELIEPIDNAQLTQGFFHTSIVAQSGWHKLTLTGYSPLGAVDSSVVPKVGVGEVFLIAGNSNAMGLPDLGAKSGTENVISFNAVNKILNQENITVADDKPMPAPTFSPIDSKNNIFPSGETSWYWGELGEMLYQKLGVPVLFLNASWAAANSENYRDGALGKDAYNLYVGKNWPNRQPYSNIKNTLRYFNSWLGIRAVLWAHGENDAQLSFSENVYFDNIRTLIETSRKDAGFTVPWIMARSSASATFPQPYKPVINAQNRFFTDKRWMAYPGPNLDSIQIPRPAHGHFENVQGSTQGLTDAAHAWNAILNESLLSQITPVQPTYSIHTGVAPAEVRPGAAFPLPYTVFAPTINTLSVQAELLDESGAYITTVGIGKQSPLSITIPGNVPNGVYKIRVTGFAPITPGSISAPFAIHSGLTANQYVNQINAKRENSTATISWLVSASEGLTKMTLQKTTNGETYTDIAIVEPTDNQTTSHLYSHNDIDATASTVFYRVMFEFTNGERTFSPIATLFAEGVTPYLLVFPNPVTNQTFRLRTEPDNEILACKLYDMSGREFMLNINNREMQDAITARPAGHLSSGRYILKVITQDGSTSQSVLIL